jgi:glycosyltransferase involved in cell wall biosynthesis
MKVLIVHPQMAMYGGAEVVIVKLARYLQEHGHKASILTLTTANLEDYKGLDIITPTLEEEKIQWRPRDGSLNTLKELYGIYKSLKFMVLERAKDYDVINPHNFPAIWAMPNNKPVVWQANEIPDLWHNQRVSTIVNPLLNVGRYGDRVIANRKKPLAIVADKRMRSIFEHRYGFRPEVVHYGVDSQFWDNGLINVTQIMSSSDDNRPDDFGVIVPSMITPSKRQMDVLVALNQLKIRIPNLKVIFAGYYDKDSAYALQLQEYIKDNALEERVLFTGMVNRETLRSLYKLTDVAIFSGRGQGSWLGGFEALSAGVPIIVSPMLSCSDLIENENLGIVSDNLVDNIKEGYYHQDHYKKNVKWQKEWVKQNLTWDNYCNEMLEYMKVKLEYF